MAIQHLFAWSSKVDGALIAAGSPYGCGQQPLHSFTCYYGGIDVNASIRYVHRRHIQGLIDSPFHLRSTPVVLFSGTKDWVVFPTVMRSTEQQLAPFLYRPPLTFFNTTAAHVWSIDHGECDCGKCALFLASSLCCNVNNCELDLCATPSLAPSRHPPPLLACTTSIRSPLLDGCAQERADAGRVPLAAQATSERAGRRPAMDRPVGLHGARV